MRSGLRGKECITNDCVSVRISSIENAHRVCVTLVITGKGAAGSGMLSFSCDFLEMSFPHRKSENEVWRIGGEEGSSAEMNFSKEGERRRRSST